MPSAVHWEGGHFQLKRYVTRRTLVVLVLFLLAASPLVYRWLDHTLVFYDRLIQGGHAISPVRVVLLRLCSLEDKLSYYVSKDNESRDIFLSDLRIGVDNMKMLVEKYPSIANSSVPFMSFYILGDSVDVFWLGYDLEPPHVEGRFGLDRASPTIKESIEKRRELLYGHSLYGSLSIDSPPISDDRRYLFKASDSVVWIRAFKVEAELKDALFRKETHDEQVF